MNRPSRRVSPGSEEHFSARKPTKPTADAELAEALTFVFCLAVAVVVAVLAPGCADCMPHHVRIPRLEECPEEVPS